MSIEYWGAVAAVRITGLGSRDTLDYWHNFLPASHTTPGGKRRYSFPDLVAIKTAAELRRGGVSLQALRKTVAYLQSLGVERPLSEVKLVVHGDDVIAVTTADELLSALREPGQGYLSFVVNVGRSVDELKTRIAQLAA